MIRGVCETMDTDFLDDLTRHCVGRVTDAPRRLSRETAVVRICDVRTCAVAAKIGCSVPTEFFVVPKTDAIRYPYLLIN